MGTALNCIIVDDEELSSNLLKLQISQIEYLNLVQICKCPMEAITALKTGQVDLMFLDVQLPVMSGLDLLKSIDKPPLVILTTAHKEYALEAFENNVVDYLVKPIGFPKLLKSTEKAKQLLTIQDRPPADFNSEYIFLKKNAMLNKVLVKDIKWIEASGDYVNIHTAESNYTLHLTLKTVEKKLPADRFLRVHRSFMVQLEHVSSIDDNVICIGNKLIPMGSMYKGEFMLRVKQL